jgi:hypothetical protein
VAADLGSKELKLLAEGPAKLSAGAADQPYFYEARVVAAKNIEDAQGKIQLLSNAVADWPLRKEARYDLFEAAAGARADRFALASLEGTPGSPVQTHYQPTQENEREEAGVGSENEEGNESPQSNAHPEPMLTQVRQARIAFEAAEVLDRLGRLKESLMYLKSAYKLENNGLRRKPIAEQIAAIRRDLRRQALNQERRPVLHEALEQNRVVRPRIPMTSAENSRKGAERP